MEVTSEEIRQRLGGLSDEEFLAMVRDDPSHYIPGALGLAAEEVAKRGLTFFKLDWLNKGATALTCSECGLIQWFAKPPKREFSQRQEK